jgi:hypothetical protein
MTDESVRRLAAAVTLQAVRDYFKTTSDKKRNTILKDLRSPWMDWLTNGTSVNVAEQLEKHPAEIKERLRRHGVLKAIAR